MMIHLCEKKIMSINHYNKTALFFSLSTALPWSLWFLAAYISRIETQSIFLSNLSSIIAFLGLLAPVLITIVLAKRDKVLRSDLASRFFNFKGIQPIYLFYTCFLMLASILLAQAISLLFGYSVDQFRLAHSFSFSSGIFPVWFMLIIAPLVEELAWHSYGTDSLRSRFNLFKTSMIFALFWGIWHLPLGFIKDYYHSNLVEEGWIFSVNFLLSLFPFVLIMNWIYYKTNRNIILTIIFHITAGFFNEVFATDPMSKVIQTGVLLVFSIYLLISDKAFFFNNNNTSNFSFKNTSDKNILAMTNKTALFISLFIFACSISSVSAQTLTQTIRGKVYDNITNETLPFASILVMDSDPLVGTTSDIDGNFLLEKVELGRKTIRVSMIGYDTYEVNELLVSSGKAIYLEIALQQNSTNLEEVVVRVQKETSLNSMTTLSSRQFTVEETQRYAGGMDDPARLVSSFAGVATPSVSSNGISVRGNNPDGLLWLVDGVEVPTPNHFANLTVAGGGLLTVLSSQVMGNSDFFMGAFPAEYGNASSGVFDIKLKKGNSKERQYSFQAGLLGIGLSAEGPFKKDKAASYIFNYRYSTFALLAPILPDDTGILKYQDLTFKTSFPTKKNGTFTLWGIGAIDGNEMTAVDSVDWKSNFDRDNSQTSLYLFTTALSHQLSINSSTFLNTNLSISGNGLTHKEQRLDDNLEAHPRSKAANNSYQYTIQSKLSKRFSNKHSNKTGIRYTYLKYDLDVEQSLAEALAPVTLAKQKGSSSFIQFYSQSKINLLPQLSLNVGINSQYFFLNKNIAIEPRLGLKYNLNSKQSIAIAYGLHSRLEQLAIYFVSKEGALPNKDLKFMKSAHYIFSFNTKLTDNLNLSIEPYYQQLTNVPVSPSNYMSSINNNNTLFYNEALVSQGKARNIGIDISLEKYLSKGFYYMLTTSIFDSKYTGADGIVRNTRFNRNFVMNALVGKEWETKRNNIFSANIRLNYLGGNRKEPIDVANSLFQKDVVYAETENQLAFSEKFADQAIFSFTISYRKNKAKYSSLWSLQILNATSAKDFSQDVYNIKTKAIDTNFNGTMIPNISYKIEF